MFFHEYLGRRSMVWLAVCGALAGGGWHATAADIEAARESGRGTNGFRSLVTADRLTTPLLAPASKEGEARLKQFKLVPGLKVDLWAAEPMLANPVAFSVDERGRIFTSETYRYRSSVLDIRHYMFMLEDDLASRSNEDRLAVIRKWFGPDGEKQLGRETEVIRLLEDTDHDGRADRSTVFADGFTSPLSGIASGVLARHGEVWVTEIPSLWRFSPTAPTRHLAPPSDPALVSRPKVHDDNFHAEELLRGWGVRFSFTGHDLHGLKFGPDGRLYFSVGDRGTHVVTREGRTIDLPEEGAVFRCEPDGSQLAVVAHGLRNPQELAFNELGDLFTGDNDSDQGDRERWVQVVEGMDAGWRVGHQHAPLGNAGMWNMERLWVPHFAGQAAYILPPIANIGDGPSGLVYDYGTTFPAALQQRFLLAYFKGTSSRSGIYSLKVRPSGAGYSLVAHDEFVWNSLVPDVDLGPDGSIYFADWHEGWPKSNKGRIYRAWFPEVQADPVVKSTQKLLGEGMDSRGDNELLELLGHRDFRVRQDAQFELAHRGGKSVPGLARVAREATDRQSRLHAIWGLGQITRQTPAAEWVATLEGLIALTTDPDAEIRGQVGRLLGEARVIRAQVALLGLTADPNPRVVAQALSGLRFYWDESAAPFPKGSGAVPTGAGAGLREQRSNDFPAGWEEGQRIPPFPFLAAILRSPNRGDLVLRQHVVNLLVAAARALPPGTLGNTPAFAPRTAASTEHALVGLLALRALPARAAQDVATLVQCLASDAPALVQEAARTINDLPVVEALPALAALAEPARLDSLRRALAGERNDYSTAAATPAGQPIRDVRFDQPLPWTNAPVDPLTPLLLRIVNANFRVGDPTAAVRLAALATNATVPALIRSESLFALSQWAHPPARDRITGLTRPLPARSIETAQNALSSVVTILLDPARSGEAELVAACGALQLVPVNSATPLLAALVRNPAAPERARAAALRPWVQLQMAMAGRTITGPAVPAPVTELLAFAAAAAAEGVRLEASKLNAELNPQDAAGQLAAKLTAGSMAEQQSAYVSLGELKSEAADAILAEALDKLMRREIAPEATLDLVEAAAKRSATAVKSRLSAYQAWKLPQDHLTPYREALVGGNAARGRKIFYENASVACTRCHQIGTDGGGNAGPKLDGVASRTVREYLLESIVAPNQQIAPGFEAAIITRKNGDTLAGTVRSETAAEIVLLNPEDGSDVHIPKTDVQSREKGVSGMPEGFGTLLSRQELRDVLEFLGTLK